MSGLKEKVAKGAIWVTLEKLATQVVGFVVGMVLARLLTPTDYGTVAMLSIFFAIAGSIVNCGFGNALVQKKDVGDLEFNSVFYISVGMSLVVYVVLFMAAPHIAEFYKMPVLCPVTRVSAISFVLNAINSIQGAELMRKMLFHLRFRISLITSAVSSIAGISFALMGFGVWALVWSSLLASIAGVCAYWMIIAWRPKWMFSFAAVKPLFSYGWKLSLSGMIHTIYMNLYGFLVGRFYTPADLAYVNKGNAMPSLLMNTIDGTILGVSFPALAKLQDDKTRLRDAMRRMIQCSTFLVIPLMFGLAVCARPLILSLYGNQWGGAVPYVCIYCFSYALWPFNSINTAAISAMGRSDVYLLLECVKKFSGLAIMLISIRYGVLVFIASMCFIMAPFSVFVNTFANGRLLHYSPWMQIRDVAPSAFCGALMCGIVWCVQQLIEPLMRLCPNSVVGMLGELIVSFCVGVTAYFVLARMFRLKALREYLDAALPVLRTKMPFVARMMEKLV